MNETEILRDVLVRLDSVTQHIIEIKTEMYLKSEHREDASRMYDHVAQIQRELTIATKDAVLVVQAELGKLEARVNAQGQSILTLSRPQVPKWVYILGTAIATLVGTQAVSYIEVAFHLPPLHIP